MPIDGVVVRNIVWELDCKLTGGRIDKVTQPEKDEIILSVRNNGKNYKLLMSSSANYPRVHITSITKQSPIDAPIFCMVLRKHLSGGRIVGIKQHNLDRIIKIYVECYDELGSLSNKIIFCEIMGRRSNITLVNENDGIVIDSIRHLTSDMSSYRELLPKVKYKYPPVQDKLEPLSFDMEAFLSRLNKCIKDTKLAKFIASNFDGISLFAAKEICNNAGFNENTLVSSIDEPGVEKLKYSLCAFIKKVSGNDFNPCIYYKNKAAYDFYSLPLDYLKPMDISAVDSISGAIENYYTAKDRTDRIKQRSSDIHKIINTNLSRCYKKLSIQHEKLKECSQKNIYKLYGDLIMTDLRNIKKGDKKALVTNYYDESQPTLEIPLDFMLTPIENAQNYYKKYNKDKTAEQTVNEQLKENLEEIEYLEGQLLNLENCTEYDEIEEIRNELISLKYIKPNKNTASRKKQRSKPMHYVSSEGFDIYVGKNNVQNDYLTLKFASSKDIWMHTKKIPGSHVIIKSGGNTVGEATLNEAAALASYYSKAKNSSNVPVDYTERKNVKKPSGAKPGMVIYYTNRTIHVTPDEDMIKGLKLKMD